MKNGAEMRTDESGRRDALESRSLGRLMEDAFGAVARLPSAAAVAFLCVYWFLFAHRAFVSYFNVDDMMNLYKAWRPAWSEHLSSVVMFWQAQDRPVGQVFYRAIFDLGGFDPRPFHAARIVLFALNLALGYGLLRKLTRSRMAAFLSMTLFAFHSALWDLYVSTGTVYDLLCATFFLGAAGVYASVRGRGETLGAGRAALVVCLTVLAIGSKEMGVAVGGVLALYELLALPRVELWRPRVLWPLLAVMAVCVAFGAGRILIPGPLTGHPGYQPAFTLARVSASFATYTTMVFDGAIVFSAAGASLFWAVLLAGGALLRSRLAAFGVLSFWCLAAPLLVAPPRFSGYVLCVPLFGLACYVAAMAAEALRRARLNQRSLAAAAACFLCAATALHVVELRRVAGRGAVYDVEIRELARQAPVLRPNLPPDGKVLLVNSPFLADKWQGQFVLGLRYELRDLKVKEAEWHIADTDLKVAPGEYAAVFLYEPQTRRYSDVTVRAERGIGHMAPPSSVNVGEPGALARISAKGIAPALGSEWLWCRARSELRLTVPPQGARAFKMEVIYPNEAKRNVGPLRLVFRINGAIASKATVADDDPKTLEAPLPPDLKPGQVVQIAIDVLNPWTPVPNGDVVGFALRRVSLE